ncbi:hypothetical protein BDV30DRAFT_239049 [Aspergillus minisclerotigenes]|uniref:Uncharacterized protein n=1 Tax=Aspergillus minisclerotigenes TaxID=656917 RepID=A0A5N6J2E6_9EURO|nr:hypothetical protein BDV30DRAFT_239049 [Aspergillus minisclerotigenes]
MRFLTSILALSAIAGVSAVPTSNSATTNTVTSGEFTYNGEGVFSAVVVLPHPMQIVYLGNASAMGITDAGHATVDACSASLDRALELAGPDLGIVAS